MEENPTAQAFIPTVDSPANAEALFGDRGHDKLHFVTDGERRFDKLTYRQIGYWANVLISIGAVLAVERTPQGQKFLNGIVEKAQRTFSKADPELIDTIARKTFFLSGGFAVLAPMKWLEDAKVSLIKKWDRQTYGDKVDTDPKIQQAHAELEAAPKQTWLSVMGSRVLALIPFYLTIGALWTRESTLAKWTNSELRTKSQAEIKLMKADPAQAAEFSKITSKGIYIDRLIDSVSRGIGKGWAHITGNTKAANQIEHMEHEFPGTVRSAITKDGSHDPIHSTLPYYVISETITSAMVAWGVFALTRVLGPLIGKKQNVPAAEKPAKQLVPVAVPVKAEPVAEKEIAAEDAQRPVVKPPEYHDAAEKPHTKVQHVAHHERTHAPQESMQHA